MKYLSDMTVVERVSDCADAANDVADACDSFIKLLRLINRKAKEAEVHLRVMAKHDEFDPYDPVTQTRRLLEEIINETD
jgi:hypothetical protein